MIDATGLGVDLRWEYPWRFGAKAGALYLGVFWRERCVPSVRIASRHELPKGNPVDSRADRHDRYEAASSKMCGEELAIPSYPLSPWRVIGLGKGVIEFEMIVEMAAGTTRQAGEGDGQGEGLSGANCKS